jgi:hypothetical protein
MLSKVFGRAVHLERKPNIFGEVRRYFPNGESGVTPLIGSDCSGRKEWFANDVVFASRRITQIPYRHRAAKEGFAHVRTEFISSDSQSKNLKTRRNPEPEQSYLSAAEKVALRSVLVGVRRY